MVPLKEAKQGRPTQDVGVGSICFFQASCAKNLVSQKGKPLWERFFFFFFFFFLFVEMEMTTNEAIPVLGAQDRLGFSDAARGMVAQHTGDSEKAAEQMAAYQKHKERIRRGWQLLHPEDMELGEGGGAWNAPFQCLHVPSREVRLKMTEFWILHKLRRHDGFC